MYPEIAMYRLNRYAKAASDRHGCLPLHYARANKMPIASIEKLIQVYPESVNVQDNNAFTPGQFDLASDPFPHSAINVLTTSRRPEFRLSATRLPQLEFAPPVPACRNLNVNVKFDFGDKLDNDNTALLIHAIETSTLLLIHATETSVEKITSSMDNLTLSLEKTKTVNKLLIDVLINLLIVCFAMLMRVLSQ